MTCENPVWSLKYTKANYRELRQKSWNHKSKIKELMNSLFSFYIVSWRTDSYPEFLLSEKRVPFFVPNRNTASYLIWVMQHSMSSGNCIAITWCLFEVTSQIVTRIHLCFIHCIQMHVVAKEGELCKRALNIFCSLRAFMLGLFKQQYKIKMFSICYYLNVFQLCS